MRQSSDITLLFSTFNGFFQCTSKDSTWIKSSGKKKVTAERIEYWYWLNDLIRIYVALIKSMPIPMESTVPFFFKKNKRVKRMWTCLHYRNTWSFLFFVSKSTISLLAENWIFPESPFLYGFHLVESEETESFFFFRFWTCHRVCSGWTRSGWMDVLF